MLAGEATACSFPSPRLALGPGVSGTEGWGAPRSPAGGKEVTLVSFGWGLLLSSADDPSKGHGMVTFACMISVICLARCSTSSCRPSFLRTQIPNTRVKLFQNVSHHEALG